MSLYKRGSIWHYAFTVGTRRFRGSTKESSKYVAGMIESQKIQDAKAGRLDMVLGNSPTLERFSKEFTEWVNATQSLEKHTKRCYLNGWRLLSTTKLAGMKLSEINNHVCETTAFPGSNSNANQALRTLRRMVAKASETGKLSQVPKIQLRKEWPRSIAMSMADADKITGRMKGDPRDAFIVIRSTGMRPKEVFTLRWEFLHLSESYYLNPNGKTKTSKRAVPLIGDSAAVLKRRHADCGCPSQGWVFPSNQSPTGHMTTIAKAFTSARKDAGLPDKMVLYTARHGAMTDLSHVLNLREVMQVGGHTDPKIAMVYQHTNAKEIQAKLEAAKTDGRIM